MEFKVPIQTIQLIA